MAQTTEFKTLQNYENLEIFVRSQSLRKFRFTLEFQKLQILETKKNLNFGNFRKFRRNCKRVFSSPDCAWRSLM